MLSIKQHLALLSGISLEPDDLHYTDKPARKNEVTEAVMALGSLEFLFSATTSRSPRLNPAEESSCPTFHQYVKPQISEAGKLGSGLTGC